jgi:transcriptional regulator with XRE-family HTH domain
VTTLIQNLLLQSKQGKKELAREDLIVSVTEQIWQALESSRMTKADLARALETSKSNVTQLLGGQRNMTLATLADIAEAMGTKPCVIFDSGRVFKQGTTWDDTVEPATVPASPSVRQATLQKYGEAVMARAGDIRQKSIAVGGSVGAHGSFAVTIES